MTDTEKQGHEANWKTKKYFSKKWENYHNMNPDTVSSRCSADILKCTLGSFEWKRCKLWRYLWMYLGQVSVSIIFANKFITGLQS